MAYLNDPPPISEDAINEGMLSLLSKGLVPKDVDLTPAFEKGAPPVTCKGVKFYDKREQYLKRETCIAGIKDYTQNAPGAASKCPFCGIAHGRHCTYTYYAKREISTGGEGASNVRFDL